MPAISHTEKAEVAAWFARMDASRRVWDQIKGERNRLRRSLALRSPDIGSYGQQQGGEYDDDWDTSVSIPLDAKVASYLKSKAHDRSPEIRVSGMRKGDLKSGPMNQHLLRRVTESGGLPRASRSAIDDMLTLGAWIVWMGLDEDIVDPRRLAGLSTDAAELVALAMTGEEVHPIAGMDMLLLAATCRDRLADPNNMYGLTPQQQQTVVKLAQEADAAFVEESKAPKIQPTYRFWYKRAPYGTRTLMDSTVFMREDAMWMSRYIPMNEDQFKKCGMFTQTARNKCRPSSDKAAADDDGGMIHESGPNFDDASKKKANRYDVWEIHDRANFKVRYVADGYEGYLDEDVTPWYADENGRNAFDDGFPCEWAVPFTHNIEDATQPLGVPALLYGESVKNEFQVLRSAHLANAKRSARIAEVEGDLEEEDEAQLREARDGSFIKKTGPTAGTDRPMIRPIEWPAAPTDLLQASQVAEGDYYTLCSVNASALNGQQQAGTATQEVIINQGANNIQGDMVSVVEDAYQRLVRKTAVVARLHFTPTNAMRYVSPEYALPGPDGKAPFDEWKKESLDGIDIDVSFSTKGREPNPIRMKTYMDAIALSLKVVDPVTMMWVKDPRPLLEGLYAEMGWGKVPDYEMSKDAMMVLAMTKAASSQMGGKTPQNGQSQPSKPSANGNPKGREAGGGRGGGPVPNRQDRAENPGMDGDQMGATLRVGTA